MTKTPFKLDMTKNFFLMPRFAPAIFSAFLCGLLLLFYRELGQNIMSIFIPSLAVYAQGSALIGTLHRHLGLHYVSWGDINNEKPIPIGWKKFIFIAHFIWFGALVYYNFCRGVF